MNKKQVEIVDQYHQQLADMQHLIGEIALLQLLEIQELTETIDPATKKEVNDKENQPS